MSQPTRDEPEEEAGPGSERVRMFVSDRLILVGRDATMRQMAQRMVAEGVGALVVTEEDHVHGIVSERDVVLAIAAGSDLDSTTAGDLDSRRLVTCNAGDDRAGGGSAHDGELHTAPACHRPDRAGRHGFGPGSSRRLRSLSPTASARRSTCGPSALLELPGSVELPGSGFH
jgi:CBS domain-containing protein